MQPTDIKEVNMKTLEDLYNALNDETAAEYGKRRAAKVAEIADYIKDHLRDGVDVDATAEWIMAGAEETGRFDGDCIAGELPSRYAKDGKPLPFLI